MSHRGRRNQPLARPDSSRQESVSSHLSQPSAPTRSDDTITETGHGETEAGALARVFDGDRGYDVGAAVMFTNGSGQKPADVTGTQGIRINGPGTPSGWHFGFPLNAPFDGQDLIACDGQTSPRSIFNSDLKLACTMQGGAGGGAFLADFNGDNGYTASVNSYHLGDDLTQTYGPYFGDGAYNLYQAVRNLA